jgi:4-amino-4-deoxy-L-arabinose transferase-like glycosyltransferase
VSIPETILMKSREISVSAKLGRTAAIFMVTSIVALLMLAKATPIVWEDHFKIGQNLRSTGTLTIDDVPSIIRPPGYPAFVAAALWISDAIHARKDVSADSTQERDQRTVVFAQGILLGTMAAALFFWASLWSGSVAAASIALAAALNPYALALANLLSYHLLFVVLLTFSTLALALLRGRSQPSGLSALGVGLLWGLTSLVKPVALIIPIFAAALMLIRRPRHHALTSTILLGVGMILMVGPYVARNYSVTGQPFVTAQAGFAFWGTSIEKIDPDQPFLVWQPIWWKYGMPIFTKITGSAQYSEPLINAYAVQLNAEFSKQARQNITAAPDIYLYNVARNFISFNLDTMAFWNKFFVAHNKRLVQVLSEFWIVCLMALAAAGAIWGCLRNDDDAVTVTAVYLCIVVAYSISFATELYTISKFPLIILCFALLVVRLENTPRYRMLARTLACGTAGFALIISVLAA